MTTTTTENKVLSLVNPYAAESDPEVRAIELQKATLVARVESIKITDTISLAHANATLLDVAAAGKAVEKRRKFFVEPLNAHVKVINEFFRAIAQPLQVADRTLREKILAHRREEQAKIDEAARAARMQADRDRQEAARLTALAAKARESGMSRSADRLVEQASAVESTATGSSRTALALANTEPARQLVTERGQSYTVKRWEFLVEKAEDVPREFLVVDLKALRHAVDRGAREIPGVKVFLKESLAVRG